MGEYFLHNVYGVESNINILGLILSLILAFIFGGAMANLYYHIESTVTKGFSVTLALFPPIICVIMLLLSKNSGSGIAAIGAFALLRFKSAPGTAREIMALLISIGCGIACSTGYLLAAICFAIPVYALFYIYNTTNIWESKSSAVLQRSISIEVSQKHQNKEYLESVIKECVNDLMLVETKYDYNKTTEKKMIRYTYDINLNSDEAEGVLIDRLVENKIVFDIKVPEKKRQITL